MKTLTVINSACIAAIVTLMGAHYVTFNYSPSTLAVWEYDEASNETRARAVRHTYTRQGCLKMAEATDDAWVAEMERYHADTSDTREPDEVAALHPHHWCADGWHHGAFDPDHYRES